MKRSRILGTSDEACKAEEVKLGRRLPESFRKWLLSNNGRNLAGLHVFPVLEPSDERKTWNSLARNQDWPYLDGEAALPGPRPLLTFAEYGTGDAYCFDYRSELVEREPPVVRWSHETGECEFRASCFDEFVELLKAGRFSED